MRVDQYYESPQKQLYDPGEIFSNDLSSLVGSLRKNWEAPCVIPALLWVQCLYNLPFTTQSIGKDVNPISTNLSVFLRNLK